MINSRLLGETLYVASFDKSKTSLILFCSWLARMAVTICPKTGGLDKVIAKIIRYLKALLSNFASDGIVTLLPDKLPKKVYNS
ncbi:MAG: hypothetical protein BGO28_01350 [Alphaproteobacteria bacterium 43-37]|nr:MAG: hypothetical protein BGO28_01350 [Alphaproteobacteria bacterium 43-37]